VDKIVLLSRRSSFFNDVVFLYLAVKGHSRPVELLGGGAFVPFCFEQSRDNLFTLLFGTSLDNFELVLDFFRQIDVCDGSGWKIDIGRFQLIQQFPNIARPIVSKQAGHGLICEAFDFAAKAAI
jgi:hypothetical protein